jgi:acyl-CoA synthetase (AMP-forming)/AMP-acid ligase II
VDVENAASRAPGLKAGRLTAFGVPDSRTGSEMVVVVAERESGLEAVDDEAITSEVRRLVRRDLEVAVGRVDLVPSNWTVKTTSGKNARWATRERWLAERAGASQEIADA